MKPSMPVNANAGVAVKPTKVTFQRVVHSPTVSIHNPTIMENFIAVPASSVNTDGIQQSKATSASPKHFKLANRAPGHVTVSTLSHSQALHTPDGAHSGDNAGAGSLANTKEKTPMCLINELARFNRVTHQYTLVDEQGPAHKKNFFVKLQVDKEEYSASGPSIKKAQHAAAAIALEKTAFKHPPPKPLQKPGQDFSEVLGDGSSLTPTVELNAVAMKRGEPAIYRNIENRQNMFYPHNYDFRGMYNQRYHVMRPPRIYYVSLKVGSREFIGEGISRQAARHNAAKKALEILRSLQLPEGRSEKVVSSCGDEDEATDNKEAGDENEDSKSEISLVHEIALRNNLPVAFDVIRETGPPHMKNFVTLCTVGMFKTEADGNSKKLSKKRAAELMLKELKNLPVVISPIPRPKTKPLPNKKKNRNLIKMQKADVQYGVNVNPISRLIQIQQAQKKKEPVYTLLAERGVPRRREFVIQVQVDEHTCTGVGPNKKLAKRHAAESMLQQLGFSKPSPQPVKPAIKMQGESSIGEKKVTFSDSHEEHSPGVMNGSRQMVPGLIVLPDSSRGNYSQFKGIHAHFSSQKAPQFSLRHELKLREVCILKNLEIKFDDFSGSSTTEHLSRLVVASNPPQVLHGTGPTLEAARDSASLAALKVLGEVTKEESSTVAMAASGDASQVKREL